MPTIRRDRRLAGRARLVVKQAIDALMHEPLLPAPHAGLGLRGLGHDRRGPQTLVAQEDDTRPPHVLLRALGIRDDRAQSLTLVGRLEEADVTRRTWRIATDDGKFSGDVLENGPSLEGLKLGATYEFSCIEEIEMADGTGQEVRKVHLTDHRPC